MALSRVAAVELDASQLYACIEIQQPLCCKFTLQLSEAVVDACIDALYCGTDITDAVRQDITNELTNTIGGLLMSNLDESTPIALGLPTGGKGFPAPESGRALVFSYETDVGALRVVVSL